MRRNTTKNLDAYVTKNMGGERVLFQKKDRSRVNLGDLREIVAALSNLSEPIPDDYEVYLYTTDSLDLRSPRRAWSPFPLR